MGMCVQMYVILYQCVYVRTYIHVYVLDPVRLRLRHLCRVELCSFIVRCPTVGASVYCAHISSLFLTNIRKDINLVMYGFGWGDLVQVK